mmetsp:Transcript_4749/g.5871  ORF Transcript_4749/g.5871 Transcript_4749/m.5871 type:complete len:128 (+) Transcript_4749:251-634(+)
MIAYQVTKRAVLRSGPQLCKVQSLSPARSCKQFGNLAQVSSSAAFPFAATGEIPKSTLSSYGRVQEWNSYPMDWPAGVPLSMPPGSFQTIVDTHINIEASSVIKKRRKKMNKHKLRKRRKRERKKSK